MRDVLGLPVLTILSILFSDIDFFIVNMLHFKYIVDGVYVQLEMSCIDN